MTGEVTDRIHPPYYASPDAQCPMPDALRLLRQLTPPRPARRLRFETQRGSMYRG
jgi:hypothetical protein